MKLSKQIIKDKAVRIQEALVLALTSMYANKMRTLLTVLGIIIGVGTVVGLISLVDGLNNYVASTFSIAGTDTFWVMRHNMLDPDRDSRLESRNNPTIEMDDSFAISEQCPSVEYAAPRFVAANSVKYRDKTADNIFVIGTTQEFQNLQGLEMTEGRILLNSDVIHNRMVVALGSDTKESLFGDKECIGSKIKIGGRTFTVIGVAKPLGSAMGRSRDNICIIPVTTFNKYFINGSIKEGNIIMVSPISSEFQAQAMDEVTQVMRNRHSLKANEKNDFDIVPQSAFMETFKSLTGVIFIVIIAIGSISLLVGGVGIMNIMLVSVSERTREVGLRKSLGARQSDILMQFLLESIILSTIGGLVGVAFGIMIAQLVGNLTPLPASISVVSIILGVTFSSAVGTFFGIYPARKAAKLDPITALRYE